jgi:hypothetical protein
MRLQLGVLLSSMEQKSLIIGQYMDSDQVARDVASIEHAARHSHTIRNLLEFFVLRSGITCLIVWLPELEQPEPTPDAGVANQELAEQPKL